jgi:hypothetical protein
VDQRPRCSNAGKGVDRIEMSFDGKTYNKNVQFTTIGEPQNTERSPNCRQTDVNVMFTQMSATKGLKLFK